MLGRHKTDRVPARTFWMVQPDTMHVNEQKMADSSHQRIQQEERLGGKTKVTNGPKIFKSLGSLL